MKCKQCEARKQKATYSGLCQKRKYESERVGRATHAPDVALENLTRTEKWAHLAPLLELKPLYRELKKACWRLRKARPERTQSGAYAKNGQRMGPLTMEGRQYGLDKVLAIQARAKVDLINAEEEARIREMWALGLYPQKWSEEDIKADAPIDRITSYGDKLITQPLLVR